MQISRSFSARSFISRCSRERERKVRLSLFCLGGAQRTSSGKHFLSRARVLVCLLCREEARERECLIMACRIVIFFAGLNETKSPSLECISATVYHIVASRLFTRNCIKNLIGRHVKAIQVQYRKLNRPRESTKQRSTATRSGLFGETSPDAVRTIDTYVGK